MSEWLKGLAWKAGVWETAPRVQIPLSPPFKMKKIKMKILYNCILKAISPNKSGSLSNNVGERKNSLPTLNFIQPVNHPLDGLS